MDELLLKVNWGFCLWVVWLVGKCGKRKEIDYLVFFFFLKDLAKRVFEYSCWVLIFVIWILKFAGGIDRHTFVNCDGICGWWRFSEDEVITFSIFFTFIICIGSDVLMYQLFCIQLYPSQVLASGQRMLGDGMMPWGSQCQVLTHDEFLSHSVLLWINSYDFVVCGICRLILIVLLFDLKILNCTRIRC